MYLFPSALAGIALFVFWTTFALPAAADGAVIEILRKQVSIYSDDKGQMSLGKYDRSAIELPAEKMGSKSLDGFIKVRLVVKDPQKREMVGWIRDSDVKTDERTRLLGGKCQSVGSQMGPAHMGNRAVRGAGEGC